MLRFEIQRRGRLDVREDMSSRQAAERSLKALQTPFSIHPRYGYTQTRTMVNFFSVTGAFPLSFQGVGSH